MGTYSDIRDQRYRTELDIGTSDIGLKRAESDIVSDIGIYFIQYLISDIPHSIGQHSGLEVRRSPVKSRVLGSNPVDVICKIRISEFTQMLTVFSSTYFLPI